MSDYIYVSARVSYSTSLHPWGSNFWVLEQVAPSLQTDVEQLDLDENVFIWPNLKLQVFASHCESYYQNLTSKIPKIYLVCQQHEKEGLKPHFITVDYDEANAYIETGEDVLVAAMSETLCQWLERFVIENYQPEQPRKRRRKQWHEESKGYVRRIN